jgi:hypothetical protein
MNIQAKFAQWPERAQISVRLHLYGKDPMERCDLDKLLDVFKLAKHFGVQETISTNLNRANAVYVNLNNYVLRNHECESARPGGWGNHWGFLIALTDKFSGHVYIDPPEGTDDYTQGTRFALGDDAEIIDQIQTWDDMA